MHSCKRRVYLEGRQLDHVFCSGVLVESNHFCLHHLLIPVCVYIAADLTIHLAPVFAIRGQFKAAEDYLSKAVDHLANMGLDGGGTSNIFPPLVVALCGKTADAQRLVQQFLGYRSLQKKIHSKFSILI